MTSEPASAKTASPRKKADPAPTETKANEPAKKRPALATPVRKPKEVKLAPPPSPKSNPTPEKAKPAPAKAKRAADPAVPKRKPKATEPVSTKKTPSPSPAQEKKPQSKPPVAKKPKPRKKPEHATVYIARGGNLKAEPDYEVPFPTRPQALAFLANQHGLNTDELRKLAKVSSLRLKRRWHGSDTCAVREVRLAPDEAQRALRGERSALG